MSEEHHLYEQKSLSDEEVRRLQEIKVELDQCWDLLRQRRALREFGEDSGQARVRPPGTVEIARDFTPPCMPEAGLAMNGPQSFL